jgi:hypothetical protein
MSAPASERSTSELLFHKFSSKLFLRKILPGVAKNMRQRCIWRVCGREAAGV